MKEDYVSFEIAKLLKEKGFDWGCYKVYNAEGVVGISTVIEDVPTNYKNREYYFLCPTHQMVMKWLREKEYAINIDCIDKCFTYKYYIKHINNTDKHTDFKHYNTYEEACEDAIKYCLINLIK